MKNYIKKHAGKIRALATTGVVVLVPTNALATVTDAATLLQQGGNQASGMQSGVIQIAGLVGLIIFAISGVKLFNARDNGQEGKGKMWSSLAAGIFLMGLWTWAAVVSNTALGEAKSADEMKSIVSGSGS